ncbi:MAG: FIST signal transduction protein [bacterium]
MFFEESLISKTLFVWILLIASIASYSSSFADITTMAHGWCYGEEDSHTAVNKALINLKKNLNGKKPAIIFFSSTSIKLNIPTMVKEVCNEFSTIPVWGATSALGIIMNNEYDYMKGSVIGLLALCSKDYSFFVRGASIREYQNNYVAAVTHIIKEANLNYKNKIPSMILFTSNPGSHEEDIIKVLKNHYGKFIPIFGGSCGTEVPNLQYSIANDESYTEGFSLCFIYTSKHIGYCYQMGYKRKNVNGIATDVDGRWVNTIDNKPALEVYNRWTDGFFTKIIENGKPIRGEGQMYHPLAMIKHTKDGEEFIIALSAKKHSVETGRIEFFACVDKGDVLTVLKGDTNSLIRRTYLAVAKAKKMARGRIAGGLVFNCSGARLLLEKKDRTKEISPQLKQAFKNKPFILMFNNGEHGCIPGSESFHGNLMLDTVVFAE